MNLSRKTASTERAREDSDLQPLACVLCGGKLSIRAVELHVGPPLVGGVVRVCRRCGAGQVVPMPSGASIASLYSGAYYKSYAEGPGIAGGSEHVSSYLRERLGKLTRRFGKGRILDFGCADGLFVAYARAEGWSAVGVETSTWAAERGRRLYGVEIFETTLEEAPVEAASLDVVHANHVLEHVPDPVAVMRAAYRLLKPGGVLIAEVPQELTTPLADFVRQRFRPEEHRPPNYHIVFFSRRGLHWAAETAGFKVEQITNLRHLDLLRKRSFPFATIRTLVYEAERLLRRGPVYVLVASRR